MSKIKFEKVFEKDGVKYSGARIQINPFGNKRTISEEEYRSIATDEKISYKKLDQNNLICVIRIDRNKKEVKEEPVKEESHTEKKKESSSSTIEKVVGEIVSDEEIPRKGNVVESDMKNLQDYEDTIEILNPGSELAKFGPAKKTMNPNKVETWLSNEQVSDLMHQVNVVIQPESIDQSRNINLTTAVILYLAQAIRPELLYALCATREDMVTVNSVCKFLVPAVIFTDRDSDRPMLAIADKTEMYKIIITIFSFFRRLEKTGTYRCVNDIYTFLEDFMKLNFEFNGTRLHPDYSIKIEEKVPFDFILPGLGVPEKYTPTKSVLNKIKTELSKISGGIKIEVVANGDLAYATFFYKDHMNHYFIDPNIVIGNGYNMFCNSPIPNNSILVNFKHKDILKKAIADPQYILTTDEILVCQRDMFMNPNIYYRIDMFDVAKFFGKLSGEDFNRLGKKLSAISTINFAQFHLPDDPRLRIKTFTSIDEFTLVSDNKTHSPLLDRHETASQIVYGLELKINEDEIDMIYPDPDGSGQPLVQKFTINYGVM